MLSFPFMMGHTAIQIIPKLLAGPTNGPTFEHEVCNSWHWGPLGIYPGFTPFSYEEIE